MEFKSINLKSLSALSLAAMLTACGNGGGTASGTDPIDKYAGTYSYACSPISSGAVNSMAISFAINKTSANAGKIVYTYKGYSTLDCSGITLGTLNQNGIITLNGTKAITDGRTVDKVIADLESLDPTSTNPSISEDPAAEKNIFLLNGNKLYDGELNGALDAEGYPLTLSPGYILKN